VESDEDVPSDDATHDDDVGNAAPTPKACKKTPSKKPKAASKELTEDEEEESDEERSQSASHILDKHITDIDTELVLLIPQASSEGSKWVCLTFPLSFAEVLDVLMLNASPILHGS